MLNEIIVGWVWNEDLYRIFIQTTRKTHLHELLRQHEIFLLVLLPATLHKNAYTKYVHVFTYKSY